MQIGTRAAGFASGVLSLAVLMASGAAPVPATTAIMSVCEVSKDFPGFRNKLVTVRGVYYYGLRQECPQKCGGGLWPSFINLQGGTTDATWYVLSKALRTVETEAKTTGKRFEIWVTAVGRLQTMAKRSPLGPCDRKNWGRGYGHLNGFPAQIDVDGIRDIEIKVNPRSPYDYGNMYHGPL